MRLREWEDGTGVGDQRHRDKTTKKKSAQKATECRDKYVVVASACQVTTYVIESSNWITCATLTECVKRPHFGVTLGWSQTTRS